MTLVATTPRKKKSRAKPKFLFNGKHLGDTVIHEPTGRTFPVEYIDVLVGPYTPDNEVYREVVAVNLGTYFKFVMTVNFFVDVNDYEKFVERYDICDYAKFLKDHNEHQTQNKLQVSNDPFPVTMYALSKSCPLTSRKVICPVESYRSNPCRDSYVFHTELNDEYNTDLQAYYRKENLGLIRFLQQGNDWPLRCRRSGELVESVKITANGRNATMPIAFQLHHILVKNRASVRKIGADPSTLIKKMMIKDNPSQLIDLMGTIALSEQEHKYIHVWNDSDITFYTRSELPWVLQDKKNFDLVVEEYLKPHGITLDYDSFMEDQKLSSI